VSRRGDEPVERTCPPRRRYWTTVITALVTNNTVAAVAVDAKSIVARHPECRWWRLEEIQYTRDNVATTAIGVVTAMAADGQQVGADILLGAGQTAFDLMVLMPPDWSGLLAFNLENRTGAAALFYLALGFEPLLGVP
jgi:hypothetical protein